MFLVRAVRVRADVACQVRPSAIRRQIAARVSSANLHAGKAIQSSFEYHVGQEHGCLQRISDDVAQIASSAKGAIAEDVIGAAGMHETQTAWILHICQEPSL